VTFLNSLRDTFVVGRFHLMRSLRTRSALLLCLALTTASMGGAWVFVQVLHQFESATARALMVPETSKPGAMYSALQEREEFIEFMTEIVKSPERLEWAFSLPFLSITHFWLLLGILPFLAAAAGSEVLTGDVKDRSLRYEILRTGRIEVVMGRFLGQLALVFVAVIVASLGTWVIAMTCMIQQDPIQQMASLLTMAPRLCAWSVPFLGAGVAISQIAGSPNGSRALAIGATIFSFIGWGVLQSRWGLDLPLGMFRHLVEPLFPQEYMFGLWGAGFAWLQPAGLFVLFGLVAAVSTFPLFARRKL